MKLAVDMASILKTCLYAGVDPEGEIVDFEGKTLQINSAMYGYEFAVNSIKAALDEAKLTPIDLIMVNEGMHSKSRRLDISQKYKENRANKPMQYYQQYQILQDEVDKLFKDLGAIAITQDYCEGDDTLAYLAKEMEEDLIVMSNDGDMSALEGINAYGANIKARINGESGRNKYGQFPNHLITTYKALVGDSSDNISGVKGFGPKTFLKFIANFGEDGLQELQDMLETGSLSKLEELASEDASGILQMVFDQRESALESYFLARVYPEWVDTKEMPLQWSAGRVVKVKDERVKHWGASQRLITNANWEAGQAFLLAKLQESPFITLDIETSTPDESSDWLEQQGKPDGVDVIGSYLCGFSLTFGCNNQYTYYISVAHRDTDNVPMRQARETIEAVAASGVQVVIQNLSFELVVLANAEDEDGKSWEECFKKYGAKGYLPNCLDTKLEASYVDENSKLGLKERSLSTLGYTQQTYDEVTSIEGKSYKMHELTAQHVFSYGCDDTICTAALHNIYKLRMQLEHSWKTYLAVEINAAYLHAHAFRTGTKISIQRIAELAEEDNVTLEAATKTLHAYLREQKWEGTQPPEYTETFTTSQIKEAYKIVKGISEEDPEEASDEEGGEPAEEAPADAFLSTKVRTPSKLLALLRAEGHLAFAEKLELAFEGDLLGFEKYVRSYFMGEPLFKGSNKQMQKMLYTVMGLPVRVRNKATPKMRKAGIFEGSPKGDALAIEYAKRDCTPEQALVLEAVRLTGMVKKRISDFYGKYPRVVHWKTGRVHSSHNQCATNTRRASSSNPNFQQLPKHQKIEGQPAKFREVFVPHHEDAVIVSLDFSAQELRVIAENSQDTNMLACYVGDEPRDMHSLTGLGILQRSEPEAGWTYESMQAALVSKDKALQKKAKEARTLGKKCNFTTEYGAAAPRLAQTLLVSEEEAQMYIDAKEDAFPEAKAWKQRVIQSYRETGKAFTMLGVTRHLRDALMSTDQRVASKAERQSVNYVVQGSSAEMTKLAEGRMWSTGLFGRQFDAEYIGPIHDEVVASVAIKDLVPFIQLMHECMVAKYANMQVPIESSISFGLSFGVQIEIGERPTEQAIQEGLAQIFNKEVV